MRISDWSSDVCSSDLQALQPAEAAVHHDVAVGAHRLRLALGRIGRHQVGALDDRQRIAGDLRAAVPEVAQEEHTLVTLGGQRSEERRVGKECVSTCRAWWSRYHLKKKKHSIIK